MALGDHLYDYVLDKLPKFAGNYLEIGVFNGDGFAKVAKSFPNRICYAVDPFIEDGFTANISGINQGNYLTTQKTNFISNTKEFFNIVHFEMTSKDFYDQLDTAQVEQLDISIIVIDGSHHYSNVLSDCELAIELLSYRKSGLIIFDDLHVQGVRQAFDEFSSKYKNNILSFGNSYCNSNYVKIQL